MGFGLQLRLLLWKNFTLKKRSPVRLLTFRVACEDNQYNTKPGQRRVHLLDLNSFIAFLFLQFAVLFELLIPMVLFLILMGIRLRREPELKSEGNTMFEFLYVYIYIYY